LIEGIFPRKKGVIMLNRILISISIIGVITTITLGLTHKISYIMPFNVYYSSLTKDVRQEVDCLAENIYFESAHEPNEGKIAVAFVTLNRMKSGKFANTICGVVKQKVNNTCQFSWWCEDKYTSKVLTFTNDSLYNDIRNLAIRVYLNYDRMGDPSKGALYYHADYVNPQWKNMSKTVVIGRHIFYTKI